MPKLEPSNSSVRVKAVHWGKGRWGVAGSLDSGRYHVAYLVGTQEDAVAEAERLEAGGTPKGSNARVRRERA
jgi:hypothetical protein